MCTCARPYRRVGQCSFGGRGVTVGFLEVVVAFIDFLLAFLVVRSWVLECL
jgi:hypothetical protein